MTSMKQNTHYVPGMGLFAQLLASENLDVRVDAYAKTATFYPDQRQLVLPHWSGFDHDSWMLLIAHEVGHALETPQRFNHHPIWCELSKRYADNDIMMVANVFEDIRIERLIRKRFSGLNAVFVRGYHSMSKLNFFGVHSLTQEEFDKRDTLDRLNLYAKVGNLWCLTLTDTNDIRWFNRGLAAETFDDTMMVVRDVMEFLVDENNKREENKEKLIRKEAGKDLKELLEKMGVSDSQDDMDANITGVPSGRQDGQEQNDGGGSGGNAQDIDQPRQENTSGQAGDNQDSQTVEQPTKGNGSQQTNTSSGAGGTGAASANPFTCESQKQMERRLDDARFTSGRLSVILPKPKAAEIIAPSTLLSGWGHNPMYIY